MMKVGAQGFSDVHPFYAFCSMLYSLCVQLEAASKFLAHIYEDDGFLSLSQVNYCSIAHNAGLRTKDYIVEVNGSQVFGMNHDDCKNLIKRAGDHVVLRVERGDFIVPNMDEAFPKKKNEQATTIVSEPDGSEPQVPP